MFDPLGEAMVFSKLNLKTGLHQTRVRPDDIDKTAFNTKYSQFEYLVMPMGLCNAPETFRSLMNRIFYDIIAVFLVVYREDVLTFDKDVESILKHLRIVLKRLHEREPYVSPKKCEFMREEIDLQGFLVGKRGLRVNPEKVEVLKTWQRPETLTDVRRFVVLLQFSEGSFRSSLKLLRHRQT